jgi:hypothetical protein
VFIVPCSRCLEAQNTPRLSYRRTQFQTLVSELNVIEKKDIIFEI